MMDAEMDKFFGLCKCCLEDGCFRSLWDEYNINGVQQNYGDMLNECFSLQWTKPDNMHLEQICDDCSKRTMEAYSFKQLVLSSHKQLTGYAEPEEPTEYLDAESGELAIIVKEETSNLSQAEEYEFYEEIEYLEEPVVKVEFETQEQADVFAEEGADDPDFYPEVPVTHETEYQPQKKRRRQRTYKNYSSEDLNQCFEAAKSGRLTVAQAAKYFNVPRKTIAARLLNDKRGTCLKDWQSGRMTVAQAAAHYNVPRKAIAARLLNDKRGIPNTTKTHLDDKLISEIQTLLTYTNMSPYKTRTAHYHCAYCGTYGPAFEDPDELRTHTRTQHAGERTKAVTTFMRPQWLNEILKVDIDNLHCTVCCTFLASWNDMFKHLSEQHQLVFEAAYTKVIPYMLKQELRCVLCKESLSNYHHLDSHMNAHYDNYVCSECGDSFLAASRLKKHLKIHETGRFICDECGKVFTLDKYRKKHVELVHKHEQKIACLYCPEKFLGTYPRHLHVMQHHREKVRSIYCELCGKTFDWRPYFLAHIRRKHNNEKNYKCKQCDQRFFMISELKRHEASHEKKKSVYKYGYQTKTPGKYNCQYCGKQYANKNCLITHIGTHETVLDENVVKSLKAVTKNLEVQSN